MTRRRPRFKRDARKFLKLMIVEAANFLFRILRASVFLCVPSFFNFFFN